MTVTSRNRRSMRIGLAQCNAAVQRCTRQEDPNRRTGRPSKRSVRGALITGFLAAVLSVRPAPAFEFPGLGEILGTREPLAVFPDTLAQTTITSGVDVHDIYRSRQGPQTHGYRTQTDWTSVLARAGPVWVGVQRSTDRLDLSNSDVLGHRDALSGGREAEHLGLALAGRWRTWQARGLLGYAHDRLGNGRPRRPADGDRDLEAALAVNGGLGGLGNISARFWSWSSYVEVSQTLEGTRYLFPFHYRDDNAEMTFSTRPIHSHRLTLGVQHQAFSGRSEVERDFNHLHIPRWKEYVRLERLAGPRLDAEFVWDDVAFDVVMAMDGSRFLEMRDLDLRRRSGELGCRLSRSWRLALGRERWHLGSDYPSYFEPWPFSALAGVVAMRFRLEEIDMHWDIDYLRGQWRWQRGARFSLGIDGRYEHWRDDGHLYWKERVPVAWPLFFRFEHHQESLRWPFTRAVQLEIDARWALGWGLQLETRGRAILPWGRPDPEPHVDADEVPPGGGDNAVPSESRTVRGGLRWVTALRWTL